ncbi:MAG: aspartate aminotransferase family protein [Myxococcaceae bacterium]|nr:aspartate aminotransferase family protein [Myxococcaceae bacterium]
MSTATTNQSVIDRAKKVLLGNYKQQPVAIDRGQGVYVWDVEGRRYLDMICGVATNALGHCHPELVAVAKAQLDKCWHTANGVYNEPQVALAEKLLSLSGLDRAFFCNSGGEANEALIKLARRYQKERGEPERVEFVCFENSFHGRTLATLTATGQPKYQKGFDPLPAGFRHVPYGDVGAVKQAVGRRTAAILVEPVQGEGGVHPAPEGFLRELRRICDDEGALLLIDEIQTGMGRTGKFFGFQWEDIRPDAISMAKALGNGIPVGAMLCREEVGKVMGPGSHGSTFGGNLVACAVATRVVEILSTPSMLETVRENGAYLLAQAQKMKARLGDKVVSVRGKGLLFGCELAQEAGPVLNRCRELGLIVNLAGERTLRMAPAFIATRDQLDEALSIMEQAIRG